MKISKKIFFLVLITILLISLIPFGFFSYFKKKTKTPVKEEIKREKTVKDLLKELTTQSPKEFTKEEKEKIKETLKNLTPQKSSLKGTPKTFLTSKNVSLPSNNEIYELLKKLTPK